MKIEIIEFDKGQILNIVYFENETYFCIKKTCQQIGLTQGQCDNEVKKIKKNFILENGVKYFSLNYDKQLRLYVFLKLKYLSIWLSGINIKSLNEHQYEKYIKLLNFSLSDEFDNYKVPVKIFSFESELRDEIYNYGAFDDIKIVDKEVTYSFGRIDLLGTDGSNKKVCIELKKYGCFSYLKEQLLKYKKSGCFDRVIYCAYKIEEDIKKWCNENEIEIYTYNRSLNIIKYNKTESSMLDINIRELKFGLEDFQDKFDFYPTREIVMNFKQQIIEKFENYQNKLRQVINTTNHNLVIQYDIILFYLKTLYEDNTEEFVDSDLNSELEMLMYNCVRYIEDIDHPKILKVYAG